MEFENIIVEKKDNYAIVKINRTKVMNALNPATIEELDRAFWEFGKDRSILGVILTGEGRAFVAGADLGQGNPGGSENPAELT
ncbi:MAG: enoyl-CoA hydratase-related protein, partial [Anaerovorax sp.]